MDYETYRRSYFRDPPPEPRFPFSGAFGVTLYFEDFEGAVAYYTGVLGPPGYVEGDGTTGWRVGAGWLTLLRGKNGSPRNIEVTFEVKRPADAVRLQKAFLEAGATGSTPSDQLMYRPVRSCPVVDPWGTEILIVSPVQVASAVHGLSSRSQVALREIDAESVRTICALSVRDEQQKFVAPNAVSIAEAHFSDHAWFRAIYADELPVGFLMLADQPNIPEYYLWRFMIDSRYQGMGFGRRALELLIEHVRTRPNATELFTSILQAAGGPQRFYERLGFRLTGDYEGGEAVMRLRL